MAEEKRTDADSGVRKTAQTSSGGLEARAGEVHTHTLEDGSVLVHSHGFAGEGDSGSSHTHKHSHTQTKAVLNRLSRAIGHLQSIRRMVEDGRDCSEVLIQLSAVRAALNNTGKIILQDHIEHCLVDAIESGDRQVLEELNQAIDQFLK